MWRLVCRLRLVRVGSVRMVGWHLFLLSLFRDAICPLLNEKRSRFSTPASVGCVRSPATWVGHRRRSLVSCAATPLLVAEVWSIGPRPRSGIRTGAPAVRRFPNLPANDALREYVQDRLGGVIARPDGELVPGPQVRWVGRRHGPRKDRRWATSWSPEQISNRLRVDFPHNESMRISHEAIYQALYVQGRGALKRELVACLRTGRALRVPRARTRQRGKKLHQPRDHDQPTTRRSRRPGSARTLGRRPDPGTAQLRDRGRLLSGPRGSRCCYIFPPMAGHREQQRVPQRTPSCRPRRSSSPRRHRRVDHHPTPTTAPLPEPGTKAVEMAQHAQLRIDADLDIYFCDPQSHHGNVEPTRTPTASSDSTSPKAPTSPDTQEATWTPSLQPSTVDPAKPSTGRPQPRPSPNT